MINSLLVITGLAALVVAASLISIPAGFAVAGVSLIVVAVLKELSEAPRNEAPRASRR
jgi:hypothetical protein